MNWIQSLIYGLVSGLAKFLPISSRAHQNLLLLLFGCDGHDPIRNFLIHGAMLLSVYSGCRSMIEQLRRENAALLHMRGRANAPKRMLDLRLVKNAIIPMLIGILVFTYVTGSNINLMWISLFLLINGIIIFIPERMIRANRDARTMSFFDSILMGVFNALSAIPGFSGIGCTTSVAISRGADSRKALDWALLMSIPAIVLFMGIDFVGFFSFDGFGSFWSNFFGYILSAVGAYVGGYISILLIKFLAVRNVFSSFSYYCWGASLISFMLYLTVA